MGRRPGPGRALPVPHRVLRMREHTLRRSPAEQRARREEAVLRHRRRVEAHLDAGGLLPREARRRVRGSLVVGATVFVAWVAGLVPVRGYTPLILTVLFSSSLILFGLGIVGGYVWRAFENTKGRPLFIPLSRETFGEKGGR